MSVENLTRPCTKQRLSPVRGAYTMDSAFFDHCVLPVESDGELDTIDTHTHNHPVLECVCSDGGPPMSTANTETAAVTKLFTLQAKIAIEFAELVVLDRDMAAQLWIRMGSLVGMENQGLPSGDEHVRIIPASAKSQKGEETNFDAIAKVFVKNGNEPINKIDIGARSGVGAASIHSLVYTTHAKRFERTTNPNGGKHKLICLTQEAYEQAKTKFAD